MDVEAGIGVGEGEQAEIDAIANPAAQEDAQELYDALVAEGRDVISIQSAEYVPGEDAGDGQQARSMPSDCHMTLGISRSGQNIFNDTKTDCSVNFQRVQHIMGITGVNPWNPFDQNEVRSDTFVTNNALSAWEHSGVPMQQRQLDGLGCHGQRETDANRNALRGQRSERQALRRELWLVIAMGTTATRTPRKLIGALITLILAVSAIGSASAVHAAEQDTPEVTVYIGCTSSGLITVNATIVGVAAQQTLPATYNVGGGTEHSLGNVWTGQYGIGSTNTEYFNSPSPAVYIYVTIGGVEGKAKSKTCV